MQVLPVTDGIWGSLFFVNLKAHEQLDGKFPVFGRLQPPEAQHTLAVARPLSIARLSKSPSARRQADRRRRYR